MLLPSALSCHNETIQPQPHQSSRPFLPLFDRYDPCRRSQSPVIGLIASCRALHSMLGDRFAALPSPPIEPTRRVRPLKSPFGQVSPPPAPRLAPRGLKKRRRDECEDEDIQSSNSQDQSSQKHNDSFSTPKRRRIVPLDLPAGLQASDFEALGESTYTPVKTPIQKPRAQDTENPISAAEQLQFLPTQSNCAWSENDDRLLVETVLSKLNLSSRDWNDCARRLGKDKYSLGRRWQSLVGGGHVGLRRGAGRMERINLDIRGW